MTNEDVYTVEELKELLESKGVKPSLHRLRVLQYIVKNKNHPSVDMIYKSLHEEIPTLSKTTIYNTLKLLQEKGIVSGVNISEGEVRYDFVNKPHAHFLCVTCGKIYDLPFDTQYFEERLIEGNEILEMQINIKGICVDCLMKKNK